MKVRYYVDAMTGEPHIHNHGVTEAEVEETLARAEEDRPSFDGARVVIGRSSAGRYLRAVYVSEPGGAFVITAYDLTANSLGHLGAASAESDEKAIEAS